jgi:polyisoprenoid-binding protein YceI
MTDLHTTTGTDLEQLTGDYTIDPSHSSIGFVARHAMVTKVRGTFDEYDGSAHIDGSDPSRSSAKVVIQATSIDTRNADRDAHLRSNDFLAMEQHPEITFVSSGVERVDDRHYRVSGDLTIKGVSKPVSIVFEHTGAAVDPFGNQRVGFEGSVTVNRKDWGVNWNAALEAGGVLVSEKVTLTFDISAVKR